MKTTTAAILTALFALAGCRRTDVREFTVHVPGLSETNKAAIVQALSKYNGVEKDSFRWDMSGKTLTLRYDSMSVAHTNIRMAIAEKGIEVSFPSNTTGRAGH